MQTGVLSIGPGGEVPSAHPKGREFNDTRV